VKRTFHIEPTNISQDDVLLCEFSQHHICIARADAISKKLKGVSYYELRNLLEPEKLQDILTAEEIDTSNRLIVSSAFRYVLLIPASQFTEEGARHLFATTYGSDGEALFFNELPTYNAVLVHAIPQGLMDILKSLGATNATHLYGCLLQSNEAAIAGETLFVHFTSKKIYITAIKDGQLQLAQTYFYTTPLDVVYYLLSIGQQYGFSQSNASVFLSGLISEDSAMYKELYQYFSNIQFWRPSDKALLPSEYAPHFFSSLYNLAACAL